MREGGKGHSESEVCYWTVGERLESIAARETYSPVEMPFVFSTAVTQASCSLNRCSGRAHAPYFPHELTVRLHIFGRPYYRSCLWFTVSSVCLSVTFCIVAKRYVLAKNCLKE